MTTDSAIPAKPEVGTEARHPYKRARLIINPKFQWTMVFWGAAVSLVIIVLVYFSDLFLFMQLKSIGIEAGFPPDHVYFQTFNEFESRRTVIFSLLALLIFTFIVGFYVIFSHRIAGPIYRAVKYLTEDIKGDKPRPLHFRNGDFFPELAAAINQALGKFISKKDN